MGILNKVIVICMVLVLPLHAAGASDSKPAQTKSTDKKVKGAPIYKPPLRGAPSGRIGGGTRGASERESFSLHVLAPDHIGYSTTEQPCLYWYISNSTGYPLELTVTERKAVAPLLEKNMTIPESGGIQSACLGDYGVTLVKDRQYKWFVTLVVDPERRSKDILAGGMLEVVDRPSSLAGSLDGPDGKNLLNAYAGEGLWYDAIDGVSRLIKKSPEDSELREWRSSLLNQVGLAEIAEYENNRM